MLNIWREKRAYLMRRSTVSWIGHSEDEWVFCLIRKPSYCKKTLHTRRIYVRTETPNDIIPQGRTVLKEPEENGEPDRAESPAECAGRNQTPLSDQAHGTPYSWLIGGSYIYSCYNLKAGILLTNTSVHNASCYRSTLGEKCTLHWPWRLEAVSSDNYNDGPIQ